MTDESGPINKGKYWRTEFGGLKPYEIIKYNDYKINNIDFIIPENRDIYIQNNQTQSYEN